MTVAAQDPPLTRVWSSSDKRLLWAAAPVLLTVLALGAISPIAAGLVYAPCFLLLAWTRPEFALVLVFAAAPFQNDLSIGGPVRFSLAELNLALLLPVYVLRRGPRPRLAALAWPIALYLGICVLSSLGNARGAAVVSLVQMVLYTVLAVTIFAGILRTPDRLIVPLYALAIVGTCLAAVGLATRFHFMGLHKNGWGASLSTILVVTLELWLGAKDRRGKRWLGIALAVVAVALVVTVSRGGWLAAMTGAFVLVLIRKQYRTMLRAGLLLIPCVAIAWFLLPDETRDYAVGFDASRWNIKARYESAEFALAHFRASPVLGAGVGLRKEFDATNIVLTVLAETGLAGLAAFLLIHVVAVISMWRTARHIGLDHRWLPFVSLAAALLMGRLAHGMVDHYWSRGAITPAWCAVGMANAVFYATRSRTRGRPA